MISKMLYKIKKSKLLLGLTIIYAIIICVDLVCVILNAVQLIMVKSNSAKLLSGFYGFNIAMVIINLIAVALIITLLILRKVCYIKFAKNSQKGRN